MSRVRTLGVWGLFAALVPACTALVSTAGLSGGTDGPAANDASAADAPSSETEAGSPADGSVDAAPSCDPSKPFAPLTVLTSPVSSPSGELAGYFSPDRLTVYVASNRAGSSGDLYVFTRPS
ncbi:MAG: hypothetical protein JWP87_6120, partial [Labilithrix sp.]|nr:hypothetical protein [Labilithrix sp.]